MRYDDDRYLDSEDDNDLWDDELDLASADSRPTDPQAHRQTYASESTYSPYHADGYDDNDENGGNDDNDGNGVNGENDANPENDYYSDPEPPQPKKKRRGGLFSRNSDDEEGNDFYDSEEEPTPRVRKPKPPKLDPEDPDYWIEEEEESPLSGIISQPVKKWKWKLCAAILALVAILFVWVWFFRPHTDSAVKYGYIKNMERRGSIIKTFEGTMIPYKELGDPNPFYFEVLPFSVQGDSLAALMKKMMLGCVPVRVEYEMYHSPLPWKGEARMVIIKADTADPRKILPPEYRH